MRRKYLKPISLTVFLFVFISKLPRERTAICPRYSPCFDPEGIIALAISPVWKPLTIFEALADVLGNPYLSTRHICLEPRPLADIINTLSVRKLNLGKSSPTDKAS